MLRLVNISLLFGIILFVSKVTHELELIIDNHDNSNKSAIACQDSLIELDCEIDEYPRPVSGYYGRYSIQACNPNYKNFPTGCINSNIMENFEKLCNKPGVCRIMASSLLFGSPCGNSTHVLEVNYVCIKIESTTTIKTLTKITTANIEDEYNDDEDNDDDDYSTIIDFKTIKDDPLKVDDIISSSRIDYIIEENIKNESKISLNGIANIINSVKQTTVELEESKEQSTQALINTANLLLNKTDAWKELNKKEKMKSATLLMDLIEKEIFSTNSNSDNIQIDTKNIAAELKFNKELKSELQFPTSDRLNNTQEKVFLKLKNPKSDQKFLFMVYNNLNDFMSDENMNRGNVKGEEILNTNIISFKMNKEDEIDLKEYPVELTFQHLNESSDNKNLKQICSYWYYDQITYEGEWKQDGCKTIKTNKTHTICSCNHLTHFAVLMDIHGVYEKLQKLNYHSDILKILTIILSLLSMICLILKLFIFNFLRILKRSRESSTNKDLSRITTHLCVCLLISLFVFLSGIFIKDLKIKIYCSIIAITSHYMFLCSFFWMLLQGVQLYLMLIKIFNLERSPVSKFCLIAYGLPLIIVVVSVILNYQLLDDKGYGTETHCWLSTYQNFNLSFIIPVSIILMANLVILFTVMCAMRKTASSRKSYLNYNKKHEKFYKSLLISGYLIMTLLGLPWIAGYFILNTENTLIFSYIFTILNSSQGILIFLMTCIAMKSVREELFKRLCYNKFGLVSGSSSSKSHSTSKTNSQNNNSDRQASFGATNEKSCKEKHTKILYQFLTCLRKKNVYELKQDGSNNLNCVISGQHDSILRIQQKQLPVLEDDSHTRLLIYDPMPSYITCNHQIKNPLHFHPYHREYHHLPKRSSSHVSSNSSNSNRTHLSYVPPLVPTSEAFVVAQGPLFLQPTDTFKLRQASYHQYYLIPRQHETLISRTRQDYNNTQSINNDHLINYANHNLPQPPPPRQHFKPLNTSPSNPEEHNYSLIENELQTDLQYYCDEPICSHAIEEDDFNTNSYTEVPNQYDELDNMLASSSSSLSSFSKMTQNNNNNNSTKKSNQISTPKNASLLTFNKK